MARFGFLTGRLRAVPVALTVLTVLMMAGTGLYIVDRFRATLLHSYSELAKIYVDQFLEPYARAYVGNSVNEKLELREIEAALSRHLESRPNFVVQIWLLDGTLVYSSTENTENSSLDSVEIEGAISGNPPTHIETLEYGDATGPLPLPYLEIYLPILDPQRGTPIAVGEFYVDAVSIVADSRRFERTVWLSIGVAMLGVIGMLSFSSRQSEELRTRLDAERDLVASNRALRKESDQARLDAAQANEQILNFVGAEIHDGPVQLLGLAALMAADMPEPRPQDRTSPVALVRQAMEELRRIAAGLILPELEALDLRQTIELAVKRHRAVTGAAVSLAFEAGTSAPSVDLPRRICLYRVTQEGLTNATRHGDEGPVSVVLAGDVRTLVLTIDSRRSRPIEPSADDSGPKLGLQGMRRRLASFNGTATLDPVGDRAALVVVLPLPTADTDEFGHAQ